MRYYRSRFTGRIISEKYAKVLYDIYGKNNKEDILDRFVAYGVLDQIEEPSVIDCILSGNKILATIRYREINPDMSWQDACKAIKALRGEVTEPDKTENADTSEVEVSTEE